MGETHTVMHAFEKLRKYVESAPDKQTRDKRKSEVFGVYHLRPAELVEFVKQLPGE